MKRESNVQKQVESLGEMVGMLCEQVGALNQAVYEIKSQQEVKRDSVSVFGDRPLDYREFLMDDAARSAALRDLDEGTALGGGFTAMALTKDEKLRGKVNLGVGYFIDDQMAFANEQGLYATMPTCPMLIGGAVGPAGIMVPFSCDDAGMEAAKIAVAEFCSCKKNNGNVLEFADSLAKRGLI